MRIGLSLKKIIKIFAYLSGSILLILVFLIALVWLNKKKIEAYAIDAINRKLNAHLYVKEIHYTFFDHFPDISLVFKGATCVSFFTKDSVLFKVDKFGVTFDLWDILRSRYVMKQIFFYDGFVHLYEDSKGQTNFDILKSDTSQIKQSKGYDIKLNKISLRNIDFYYKNEQQRFRVQLRLDRLLARGNFFNDVFDVAFHANGQTTSLKIDSLNFLQNKPISINADLHVDANQSILRMKETMLKLQDLKLNLQGNVQWGKSYVELTSMMLKIPFVHLFALLPANIVAKLNEFKIDGYFDANLVLKGNYNGDNMPSLSLTLNVANGSIFETSHKLNIKQINGTLSLQAKQINLFKSYIINAKPVSCLLNENPCSLSLTAKDLSTPNVMLLVDGQVDLSDVKQFLPWQDMTKLEGKATFSFEVKDVFSSFAEFFSQSIAEKNITASVKISDGIIQHKDFPFPLTNFQVDLFLDKQRVHAKNVHTKFGASYIEGQLEIYPLVHLINQQEKIYLTGQFSSSHLEYKDLDTLVSVFGKSTSSSSNSLPFELNLHLDIKELLYRKLVLSRLNGNLFTDGKETLLENLSFATLGGSVKGKIYVEHNPHDYFTMSEFKMSNIDIRELLIEFDNFGQHQLTYDNIRGKADVVGNVKMRFLPSGDVLDSSIAADLYVEINDGELVGYEPLNGLRKFLKDRDFEHIYFDKIQSYVIIKSKNIYLDRTEIRSSGGNLFVNGWQTFDGAIEYHIELKFSELKRKKIRMAPESEYGEIVRSKINDPSIFFVITGTVDKPNFTFDKKTIKNLVENTIQQQKNEIKDAFKKEFSRHKNNDTHKKKNKQRVESGISVEWNDE